MTIREFVKLAKRVHDAEGWNLGSASTRETRNAFFERAVGIAHWGHPIYNAFPDTRWHCKDPDGPAHGSRPASDDVVVSMPERTAYDCIPSAGADGYRFEAGDGFWLPHEQYVFVPSKPDGAGFPEPEIPPAANDHKCPVLVLPGYEQFGGDAFFTANVGVPLEADYTRAGQRLNAGSASWFARTIHSVADAIVKGKGSAFQVDVAPIVNKHKREWRAALGLPPE